MARHLESDSCFVCGRKEHAPCEHEFWTNADAKTWFAGEDARHQSSYSQEAAYVAEYRPY